MVTSLALLSLVFLLPVFCLALSNRSRTEIILPFKSVKWLQPMAPQPQLAISPPTEPTKGSSTTKRPPSVQQRSFVREIMLLRACHHPSIIQWVSISHDYDSPQGGHALP